LTVSLFILCLFRAFLPPPPARFQTWDRLPLSLDESVYGPELSADGSTLAAPFRRDVPPYAHGLAFITAGNPPVRHELNWGTLIYCVAARPKSNVFAISTSEGGAPLVLLYDAKERRIVGRLMLRVAERGVTPKRSRLAWSQDGRLLGMGGDIMHPMTDIPEYDRARLAIWEPDRDRFWDLPPYPAAKSPKDDWFTLGVAFSSDSTTVLHATIRYSELGIAAYEARTGSLRAERLITLSAPSRDELFVSLYDDLFSVPPLAWHDGYVSLGKRRLDPITLADLEGAPAPVQRGPDRFLIWHASTRRWLRVHYGSVKVELADELDPVFPGDRKN
jgi:hypothetical protein